MTKNISNGGKYFIVIHESSESLINAIESGPIVYLKPGIQKYLHLSKLNLKSISTSNNPCIEDQNQKTKTNCKIHKVSL